MIHMSPVDEPIEVVAARPEWQAQGQVLRMEVCDALGMDPACVEHIGSTAVAELAAKPVIDLMVGCRDDQRHPVAELLAHRVGYEYLHDFGAPGREYLRRRTGSPWANAHIVELGGTLWRDNLMLRDFLRGDPEAAREYGAAKKAAAVRTGHLRAYSAAKSDTVLTLLDRARAWSRRCEAPLGLWANGSDERPFRMGQAG
ncbi:GrpB domain, predicted nucleotidyltransferase, UPF0157 family [Actinopolymorpha cephalotaxi]|uniref:GrpB domain, predicted nucleotidyltransferase, UPF0157 family n=1 Tax=Actinopolymorpha cephalotaxi TaxID=504797 RepID=A0A1I2QQ72_9ACTN|nr:GrpB family protein [Actinopolymorpha cephalotaxi]NYH82546.1 GrpB-like predicted nucleotidyltransferase (UPF0157 family) [Actinopolymorpha cephalotaxi]SFG30448.1 GrpB domain, predicted nucleotidyltransferase, UPF0157 family [Actinopolymorpha cephalotaxi]